jgi:hypothetical protein
LLHCPLRKDAAHIAEHANMGTHMTLLISRNFAGPSSAYQ